MDIESVITLVAQFPIVGFFGWFVIRMTKEFQTALIERDMKWQQWMNKTQEMHMLNLERVTKALEDLSTKINECQLYRARYCPGVHDDRENKDAR